MYIMKRPRKTLDRGILTVITSYKDSIYLERAIQSCINQTKHTDVVIVADGYVDTCLQDLIKRYSGPEVCFELLNVNKGKSYCCNMALVKYSTLYEYVCFLDADDKWLPTKLEVQSDHLRRNGHLAACGTSYNLEDQFGKYMGMISMPLDENTIINYSLTAPPMLWSSIMIRSSVAGDLLLRQELRAAMDYDLCLRTLNRFKITNIYHPLTIYTVRSGSITNSPKRQAQLRNHAYSLAYNLVGEDNAHGEIFRDAFRLTCLLVYSISGDPSLLKFIGGLSPISRMSWSVISSNRLGMQLIYSLEANQATSFIVESRQ
jgi:glycosyltransferase involved in cell wall biosynthesis